MPTYRNDGDVTYRINDTDDLVQNVHPGDSIETYDPNPPDDFTETVETPELTKLISGENVWTGAVKPKGHLNISIAQSGSGEFAGKVTLQRSFDAFVTAGRDVKYYNSFEEDSIEDTDPNASYRLGVATDDFGDGILIVSLSK